MNNNRGKQHEGSREVKEASKEEEQETEKTRKHR